MGMESGQNMMYHGSSIKTWLCLELKSEHTSKLKVSSWRKSLLDAQLKRSKLSLVRCFDVADLLNVGLPLLLSDWRMVLLQPIATFLRGVPSNEYPTACNIYWKMTKASDKLRKKSFELHWQHLNWKTKAIMGPFGRIPGSELSGLRSHSSGSPPSCSHSSLPSKSDLQVWLVQRASTLAQVDNGSRPSSARLRGCYVRRRPRSAATKDWFAAVHVRRCLKLSVRTLRRRSSATRGCSSACGGRRFNTEEENRHSGTDRCSRLPRQQLKAVLLLLLSACGARVSVSTKTLKSTTSPSLSLCPRGLLRNEVVERGWRALPSLSLTKTLSSSCRHRFSPPSLFARATARLSKSRQRPFFHAAESHPHHTLAHPLSQIPPRSPFLQHDRNVHRSAPRNSMWKPFEDLFSCSVRMLGNFFHIIKFKKIIEMTDLCITVTPCISMHICNSVLYLYVFPLYLYIFVSLYHWCTIYQWTFLYERTSLYQSSSLYQCASPCISVSHLVSVFLTWIKAMLLCWASWHQLPTPPSSFLYFVFVSLQQ